MPDSHETGVGAYGPKSLSDRSNAQMRQTVRHTVAAQRQQQHAKAPRVAAMLLMVRLESRCIRSTVAAESIVEEKQNAQWNEPPGDSLFSSLFNVAAIGGK